VKPLLLGLVVLLATVGAARAGADWFEDTQAIMGTRVHAELWHDDPALAGRVLADIMAEMRRIDRAYSTHRDDSDLSELNRRAPAGWVPVSAEMIHLLEESRRMSELSGGAFDVTYASAGRFYDYREHLRPDDATLRAAVEAIDYRYVEADAANARVRYRRPEVYVDLGGIAKGYAVDRAIAILRGAGIEHGAVSAGGDTRIVGDRRGEPWKVGIRDPRRDGAVSAVLPLFDTAVSTSGDYERYFEEDGVRYHHILDPQTGKSSRGARSVTILGPNATLTDGLSTSVFVLGAEAGLALIDRLEGVDAIVIDGEGRLFYSKGLQPLAEAAR
jgi:thiamine biosynthesis lipoprotein